MGPGFPPGRMGCKPKPTWKGWEEFMPIRNFCLVAILVMSSGFSALSQSGLGKWWKNSEIVKNLQLTESQIAQVEKCFLDHQRQLADSNAQLKQQEAQLKTLMQSERVDENKARTQIDRVAAARATLEKINASMMLSIRKALSKEQWKKLEEMQTVPITAATAKIPSGLGIKEEPLPTGVYMAGGPVQSPRVVYQSLPSYTQAARDARAEGIVILEAIVRKDGSIDQIKVLQGLGYGLDESAISTIKNEWKFQPGTLNGQPVDVRIFIETSFRLY
jgi:TonB family protein